MKPAKLNKRSKTDNIKNLLVDDMSEEDLRKLSKTISSRLNKLEEEKERDELCGLTQFELDDLRVEYYDLFDDVYEKEIDVTVTIPVNISYEYKLNSDSTVSLDILDDIDIGEYFISNIVHQKIPSLKQFKLETSKDLKICDEFVAKLNKIAKEKNIDIRKLLNLVSN